MADSDARLERRIRALCQEAGLAVRAVTWLPSELSLRRFARIATDDARFPALVARVDAPEDPAGRPPGVPPEPPLEPVRALLERHGLPVPRRVAAADDLELLEDLGPTSLRDAAASASPEALADLYREACALVPRLQRVAPAPGVAAFDRTLDGALFAYKADLVARWGLAARGRPATPAEADTVRRAFADVAHETAAAPRRLAHRDLQSANVIVRAGAPPGERLGLIDLQGAFLAPPEYDLVCLLRDSYVELPEPQADALAERVRPDLPDAPDTETFARRFDLLTLTRKGKDHARFVYAARERGDTRYLPYVPAAVRALRRASARAAARDPRLEPLAALLHELPEAACAG